MEVLPSLVLVRHSEVVDTFIGQQLRSVREEIKRFMAEEEEEENKGNNFVKDVIGSIRER